MNPMKCRHCRSTKRTIQARRLCSRCYLVPEIRARYQKLYTKPPPPQPEPTEAELEAMIAEQMKCLPDWWLKEDRAEEADLPPDSETVGVQLNESLVQRIRERVGNGESRGSVARDLGICPGTVSRVVSRKTWRHVA